MRSPILTPLALTQILSQMKHPVIQVWALTPKQTLCSNNKNELMLDS